MIKAVIGLAFGDEGKGVTVDHLCSLAKDPIVIRFSGGHQAGHTVVRDGIRHIFSNFGSGTLVGAPTYWHEKCTVDPVGFVNELDILREKGFEPKIFINPSCPITTPYDKFANQQDVELVDQHGTCGVGFGKTIQREEDHYSLLAGDLGHSSVMKIKLANIQKYYGSFNLKLERFYEGCEAISRYVIYENIFNTYKTIIFEGSQGLLLDKDIGFFPHVTRSNVGSNAIPTASDETYYVTRAYQTRHGWGPMTNIDKKFEINEDPNETNITHKYQGTFRKTMLDLDLLRYAKERDEENTSHALVITCLEHMKEFKFTDNGRVIPCDDENDFCDQIAYRLKFGKVLKCKDYKFS